MMKQIKKCFQNLYFSCGGIPDGDQTTNKEKRREMGSSGGSVDIVNGGGGGAGARTLGGALPRFESGEGVHQ